MLIEPTETGKAKTALDQFIGAMRSLAERARAGDPMLKSAPFSRRAAAGSTLAAVKPAKLTWAKG
jgi:glycine dehydrogenase subunit 2